MTRSIPQPPANVAGYDPLRTAGDCTWDGEEAARAVDFFPAVLTHPDESISCTAGDPFRLEQWQRDYIATLFGWRRPDGTRRFTESLLAVPRKNGKTALAAGIAIYCLVAPGSPDGSQVYSAATDRKQASHIYRTGARMVSQNKYLRGRLHCIDSTKRIVYRQAGSFYEALSGDADPAHGTKPAVVLFDELHTQRRRTLYDNLRTGQGATRSPLFLSLTTAGWDRHSICYEVWQTARDVRDGRRDDRDNFLPCIYEIGETEDWTDERTWARCNPNIGVSADWKFLREEFAKAMSSPSFENTFRNLYLNQWVEQAVRWLPMHTWDEGAGELPSLAGEPCWGGLDMSSTTDITAFVLVFKLGDGYAVLPHFWIPEDTARNKENSDRVPYREWAAKGFVTLTPGNQVDHTFVRRKINELHETYAIQEIAADRWGAPQILNDLANDGFEVAAFGQGFASMSGPAKELEKLVLSKRLYHGGNPVLRWMAGNVAIQRDAAENIKPVKDKSTGRIDGIVAAIMALGRAATNEETSWFYESNSLEVG